MKKIFLHGIIAGILSAIAGIIYFTIYQKTLGTTFNQIVNAASITSASIFACMLMAVAYWLLFKWNKQRLLGVLNVVIALLSFASIITPIAMSLPLTIQTPELFTGLVVPMHFFPALAFFCIAPFFQYTR